MASVGALAAIVNVLVLFIGVAANRLLERVVRRFAAGLLDENKRAPVVHDSDTWLLNLPRSVVKFRRHPAILLTIVCSLALVVSEVVTELGVDVSETCRPRARSGRLISPSDAIRNVTDVELGASAFFLQALSFADGPLTSLPSGFPRQLSAAVCVHCLASNPPLLSDCAVAEQPVADAGALEVGVRTTPGAFSTITEGFRGVGSSSATVMTGDGDLTRNGIDCATFVVTRAQTQPARDGRPRRIAVTYVEYAHQAHCQELIDAARPVSPRTVWQRTRAPTFVQRVTCRAGSFGAVNLQKAVMVYRTMQLENTMRLARFDPKAPRFAPLRADDVYRAVLAMKVIDDDSVSGDFAEYTSCGVYDWAFVAPLAAVLTLTLLLASFATWRSRLAVVRKMPFSSRTWFHEWRRARQPEHDAQQRGARGYFDSVSDDVIVCIAPDGGSDGSTDWYVGVPFDDMPTVDEWYDGDEAEMPVTPPLVYPDRGWRGLGRRRHMG